MNNAKKIFILLMVVFLVGGCTIKNEYHIDIKSDKSMDYSVIAAFDEELIRAMASGNEKGTTDDGTGFSADDAGLLDDGTITDGIDASTDVTLTDEQKWALIDETINEEYRAQLEEGGFKVEKYDEGEFKGYRYTKSFDNIENMTINDFYLNQDYDNVKNGDESIFTKDGFNYTANIPLEMSSELSSAGVVIQFVVTLPNEAISHNANNVSDGGKTLTWNYDSNNETIEFEFSFISKYVIYAIIVGIALLLIIIIILIIRKIMKGKKKKREMQANSAVNNPVPDMPINNINMIQGLNSSGSDINQGVTEVPVEPTATTSVETPVAPVEMPVTQTVQEMPAVDSQNVVATSNTDTPVSIEPISPTTSRETTNLTDNNVTPNSSNSNNIEKL